MSENDKMMKMFFKMGMDLVNEASDELLALIETSNEVLLSDELFSDSDNLNFGNKDERLCISLVGYNGFMWEAIRSVGTMLDAIKTLNDLKSIAIIMYKNVENMEFILNAYGRNKLAIFIDSAKQAGIDGSGKYDKFIRNCLMADASFLEYINKYIKKFKIFLDGE